MASLDWNCGVDSFSITETEEAVLKSIIKQAREDKPEGLLAIAIDGHPTSGKSSMAHKIKCLAQVMDEKVESIHVDDFHHEPSRRSREPDQIQSFLSDDLDYSRLVGEVLYPLLHQGAARVEIQDVYDYVSDDLRPRVYDVSDATMLIIEGRFILRESLREWFSHRVFLEISKTEALRRQKDRWQNIRPPDMTVSRFAERYWPGYESYLAQQNPRLRADTIIDNNRAGFPEIVTGARERI